MELEKLLLYDSNYEISCLCMESYPCQHSVKNKKTNIVKVMSGVEIYEMLKKENIFLEHFNEYADWNKKHTFGK